MDTHLIKKAIEHLEPEEAAQRLDTVRRFALTILADERSEEFFSNLSAGLFDGLQIIEDLANAIRKENN